MSLKNNDNDVSQSKINIGDVENKIETTIYHEFLDEYSKESLGDYEVEELIKAYESGIQLLNDYQIQCSSSIKWDSNLVAKFQFVLGLINHTINMRHHEELQKRIAETDRLNKDMKDAKKKMENIQKILKEITTTIISIILAVSIIPTAVAGIQNIDGRYILPFISSISLIGMSSILYVYLIHNVKINKAAIIVYIISLSVTIILWLLTWKIRLEFVPKNIESYENTAYQYNITIRRDEL